MKQQTNKKKTKQKQCLYILLAKIFDKNLVTLSIPSVSLSVLLKAASSSA